MASVRLDQVVGGKGGGAGSNTISFIYSLLCGTNDGPAMSLSPIVVGVVAHVVRSVVADQFPWIFRNLIVRLRLVLSSIISTPHLLLPVPSRR